MAILIGSGTLAFVGVIWLLFYVMIFVMLARFFPKRLDKGLF